MKAIKFSILSFVFAITSVALWAAPPPSNGGVNGRAVWYISGGVPSEVSPGVWVSPGDVQLPVSTSFTVYTKRLGKANGSGQLGNMVGRFQADADGTFEISLSPGDYVLVPDPLTVPSIGAPHSLETDPIEVSVKARKFSPVLILYYQGAPQGVTTSSVPEPASGGSLIQLDVGAVEVHP